jgi:hypothetical protein
MSDAREHDRDNQRQGEVSKALAPESLPRDRQELARLVGRLLARHWLKQHGEASTSVDVCSKGAAGRSQAAGSAAG